MNEEEGRREANMRYGDARMGFEWGQLDPLLSFGRALADPMRIRILGMLAQSSMYGQELAEALEVKPPTISHHLTMLKAAGLIHVQRENNYHHYQLNAERLHSLAALLTAENLQRIASSLAVEKTVPVPPSEDEDRAMVQAAFFKDGHLISIPTNTRTRRFVMEKLAEAFEWGHLYTEKEVNTLLKAFHEDTATLRRALIDLKLMMRENGKYWLTRPQG